ncbi:MAG: CopG family transcriptional regulator [Candidatus Promineifilaceae bacterium]
MDSQNITLALPKELLLQVKLLAVRRGTSVSALLAGELEKLVQEEEAYARARRRSELLLKEGFDLGTYGQLNVSRGELHER